MYNKNVSLTGKRKKEKKRVKTLKKPKGGKTKMRGRKDGRRNGTLTELKGKRKEM
jgi:hypothetical protein